MILCVGLAKWIQPFAVWLQTIYEKNKDSLQQIHRKGILEGNNEVKGHSNGKRNEKFQYLRDSAGAERSVEDE